MMKSIEVFRRVRNKIKGDIVDKEMLKKLLNCEDSETVIQKWERHGLLIKVRGSVFTFGKLVRAKLNVIEQASNFLVLNSHVSFESALYYYGLIKKPPDELLAIGPTKRYVTHLGTFRYIRLRSCIYSSGVRKIALKDGGALMIASKEKAVADILVRRLLPRFMSESEIKEFLIDEIGINEDSLKGLDNNELINIRVAYNKSNVRLLSRLYSATDGGRIWVADFPNTAIEKDLRNLFRPFGEVLSVKIPKKFPTMAFINMKDPLDGKQAIRNLDKQIFQGRYITVKESNEEVKSEMHIYALVSFDKKECYIGQTSDTQRRFRQHLSRGGDMSSGEWVSKLNKSPIPIILEKIDSGYDSDSQADFLETVWRFVADRNGWEVVNFPYLSKCVGEFANATELRSSYWSTILKKGSSFEG